MHKLGIGLAALSCMAIAPPQELPWDRIADQLVVRMQLQPGERVLLIGRAGR